MKSVVTFAICAVTLLTGCSLIPDYQRPDLPVAPAYPTGAGYKGVRGSAEAAGSANTIGWRDFFTDPRLRRLIEIALRNNRDLRVAMLNVAAAQAQFRVQRSALFPQISLSTIGEFGSLPANAAIPEGSAGLLRDAARPCG